MTGMNLRSGTRESPRLSPLMLWPTHTSLGGDRMAIAKNESASKKEIKTSISTEAITYAYIYRR
jgi:hypothetical protein